MSRRFDCRPVLGILSAALIGLSATGAAALIGEGGGGGLQLQPGSAVLAQVDPADRQWSGFSRDIARGIKRSYNTLRWMAGEASGWWGSGLRRAVFPLGVAVVAALADVGLLNVLRSDGLRGLVGYSFLMLYVYGRLLFSRGVYLAPKLLLLGTLLYGAVRGDLLPDRRPFGRVEDVLLIVIATRAFVASCPEELVTQYAQRAVRWRRRVARLQQRSR
jgi:hypothetical protein